MYTCQKCDDIEILPQAKREGREEGRKETERKREVTLRAEWQWPSCIASLKWGREGVNVTFKCLLSTLA